MSEQRTAANRLFVVSAPSGAGKSTLTRRVIERLDDVELSISCTTRPPRGDEKDGVDYYFLSTEEFMERRVAHDFLESAQVHGNWYGTSKKHVQAMLDAGKKVIFDIDVQGAASLKKVYPQAALVFIAPPSRRELERRLRERKTDDPAEISKRLRNAAGELVEARTYDYVIVNDDLERATEELQAIIEGRLGDVPAKAGVLAGLLAEFHDGEKSV